LRALYRGAEILVLDEPTAILTPSEVSRLHQALSAFTEFGSSVILVTHKLVEVGTMSDRVTVLRAGRVVGTRPTAETTESQLISMMIGSELPPPISHSSATTSEQSLLAVRNLIITGDKGLIAVDDISFELRREEILGIAGVAGNGQRELLEALVGLRKVSK